MKTLLETYAAASIAVAFSDNAARQETTRLESLLKQVRDLVEPHGLGVELRSGTGWHHVTLTTPSGGAVVVGQVKETSDLTIERLHEIVGTPFFVRSVDALAAQAARDAKSERRAGLLALAGLALFICGVLYAVM